MNMPKTLALCLVGLSAMAQDGKPVAETPAPRLILHVDMKAGMMRREKLIGLLREAAADGYNAVLWEVEDKVRFDVCPSVAYAEAYSKEAFKSILAEAEKLGLEPIPLLQTFGHAEYVLSREKYVSWREKKDDPTCYCVLNPEVRTFLAALLKEYLDLFGPKVREFHLGGDEARVFGTCPACSVCNKGALYAEHLTFLSSLLKTRGVRPGIWCDMVLSALGDGAEALVPPEFVIWQWDYGVGNGKMENRWTSRVDLLRKRGYDIVYCGASQCAGDDPFLVRYVYHANNLDALAAKARTNGARGFCVTSWSVRGAPKSVQRPLFAYAAKRFLSPSAEPSADLREAMAKVFGESVPFDALAKATEGTGHVSLFDLRDCLRHFDPVRPLDVKRRDPPNDDAIKAVQDIEKDSSEAFAELKRVPQEDAGPLLAMFMKGLELKVGYFSACSRWNGPKPFAPPDKAKAVAYYAEEETLASAEISARAALGKLQERSCRW